MGGAFVHTTAKTRKGLIFMARMRMITILQFARASDLSVKHSGDVLHYHYRLGHLGLCGGVTLEGRGRAPKVYYLTRRGYDHFTEEGLDLGPFTRLKPKQNWSLSMRHRLMSVDLVQSLDLSLQERGGRIAADRFDFRTAPFLGKTRKETTDFVSRDMGARTKIVPDAALLVFRNRDEAGLIFLETDMGTESIRHSPYSSQSVEEKLIRYQHYLESRHFQNRYADWGDFSRFLLLFVTTTERRVISIANLMAQTLSPLNPYLFLTTHEAFLSDPLGIIWQSPGLEEPTSPWGMV